MAAETVVGSLYHNPTLLEPFPQEELKSLDSIFVSLVLPAYNEGANIRKNLLECVEVMRSIGYPFEIVVVNDGSKDNTKNEIFSVAATTPEVRPVSYDQNAGKGKAIVVGCQHVKGNIVSFVDADLEIHPRQLSMFVKKMKDTGADIVIGSKRHPDSKVQNYPMKRRFLSWGYNVMCRGLFQIPLTDTQPGFKLFRKEVLDRELPKVMVKKWAFDIEILVNANSDGYKIVEAPIELRFSRQDGGRIGFKTTSGMFQDTLGVFYRIKMKRTAGPPKSS